LKISKRQKRRINSGWLFFFRRYPLAAIAILAAATLFLHFNPGLIEEWKNSGGNTEGGRSRVEVPVFSGKVDRVHDGDTITVFSDDGEYVKVRLFGIDAPELKQAGGRNSKKHLSLLTPVGRSVKVEKVETDQYDRLVGLIFLEDGTSVNRAMITDGQAWVYERFCLKVYCADWRLDQKAAKSARKGLWQDKNPRPPWHWRRSEKQ